MECSGLGRKNMNSFKQKIEYGFTPSLEIIDNSAKKTLEDKTKTKENLNEINYLQILNSISSSGKFSEYYFEPISMNAKQLLGINYSVAIDSNQDKYLGIEMISSEDGKNQRNNMNFILVLDISGSMGETFRRPQSNSSESNNDLTHLKKKMNVAKEVLIKFLSQLRKEDRFGIILFDDKSEILLPIRQVDSINLEELISKINNVSIFLIF